MMRPPSLIMNVEAGELFISAYHPEMRMDIIRQVEVKKQAAKAMEAMWRNAQLVNANLKLPQFPMQGTGHHVQ